MEIVDWLKEKQADVTGVKKISEGAIPQYEITFRDGSVIKIDHDQALDVLEKLGINIH